MSAIIPDDALIEEANRLVERGDYEEAWETYGEFRSSLDESNYDTGTLLVLEEAERAARESFRVGMAGFESDMLTLLYVAGRVSASAPAAVEPLSNCSSDPTSDR
jgi:hypothetical protein